MQSYKDSIVLLIKKNKFLNEGMRSLSIELIQL